MSGVPLTVSLTWIGCGGGTVKHDEYDREIQ